MNLLRITTLLFSLGLVTSLSMQGQDGGDIAPETDPPHGSFHLGLSLGAGAVADRGGMEAVGFGAVVGLDHDGPRYYEEYGSGVERSVGLVLGLDLDERFRLELSGGIAQRSVEYEMEEGGKVLLPSAPDSEIAISIPRSYLTFDADILLLGGSVGASYQPLSIGDFDLRLHGGLGIASVLDATYEGQVERNPDYREDSLILLLDPPPAPESTSRQAISDASSFLFSLCSALSLDIPITTAFSLIPKLTYRHQLTPLIPETDWRSQTFGGHVDLVWRL